MRGALLAKNKSGLVRPYVRRGRIRDGSVSVAIGGASERPTNTRNAEAMDAVARIVVAILGLLGGVFTTIVGANWFTPDLLRLDAFFPTKEVQVLDDFVFVHFEAYRERASGKSLETYRNPYNSLQYAVFDKATYVEYVWLRKTKGNYTIRLSTSGTPPEIREISPPLKQSTIQETSSGNTIMTADLALDQSPEFKFSGVTPNPKVIYVYRNGFQERNSFGGKNVAYDTDRLTFVYDFSLLDNWQNLFEIRPEACLKRSQEDNPIPLLVTWRNGVAIVEAFTLKKGDRVRIFWTWNRLSQGEPQYSPVSCEDALR
jgi:hypothetical protein